MTSNSVVEPVARDGPDAASQPAPASEVARLRLLIERQPSCLLRIAADGLILAANDAALQQLAARQLDQALGHWFSEWLPPEQRDRWPEFAGRVRESRGASVECDLRDLAGNRHEVRLHGVSQPGHPDGVESMIVTIRDITGVSRLETLVQEHDSTRQALLETRARLEALLREKADREAALDEQHAWIERESTRLEKMLADTIRFASQTRRLMQAAAGQNGAANSQPGASPRADQAGDGGRIS